MLTLEADRLDEVETERAKRTLFLVWFVALFAVLLVLLFWLFGLGGLSNIASQNKGATPQLAAADLVQNLGRKIPTRAAHVIVVFAVPGDEPWFGATPVAGLPCIRYAGAECGGNANGNDGGANGSQAGGGDGGEAGQSEAGAPNHRIALAFDGGSYGGGGNALPYIPPTNNGTVPPTDSGTPAPANVDPGNDVGGAVGDGPGTPTTPVDDTVLSNPGDADLPDIVAIDYPPFPSSKPKTFRRMPNGNANNGPGDGPGDGPGEVPNTDPPSDPPGSDLILGPRDVLIFDPPGRGGDGAPATEVPEPGSMLLLGSGFLALGAIRRRKRA